MLESWTGQETQGPQGTRKSCWVKHHLPSERHILKDLESTGLVASSHPQRKNMNKSEYTAVHTDTSSEEHCLITQRCADTAIQQHALQGPTCTDGLAHSGPHCA